MIVALCNSFNSSLSSSGSFGAAPGGGIGFPFLSRLGGGGLDGTIGSARLFPPLRGERGVEGGVVGVSSGGKGIVLDGGADGGGLFGGRGAGVGKASMRDWSL